MKVAAPKVINIKAASGRAVRVAEEEEKVTEGPSSFKHKITDK